MKFFVGAESLPLSRQLIADLARAGMMAPSIRKTQLWRIQVSPERQTVEFHAKPDRRLIRGDPGGRVVHVACGAAVFNLRVAAAVAGREPIITLLPEPDAPSLLAAIRLAGPHSAWPDEHELHAVMTAPADGLSLSAGARVPDAVLAELVDAARSEGAILRTIEDQETAALPTLPQDLEPADFAFVNDLPQLAVLSTTAGGTGWLRAGQAMERVLLTARARGILAVPFAPLPGSAGAWRVIRKNAGIDDPLIILRLGYAHLLPGYRAELLTIGPANAPIVPRPAAPEETYEGHTSPRR